jgi:hypothetical protein
MKTQEAFTISILDCAYKMGLRFSNTYLNTDGLIEHIFHCPLRNDKNASIYINETKNVWYDNGGITDGGGIISFINYLYGNSLKDTSSALKSLDSIYPELKHPSKNIRHIKSANLGTLPPFKNDNSVGSQFALNGQNGKKEKAAVFSLVLVKDLFSYPLKNYLKDDRKINLDIAQNHVKEVIYKHIEKDIQFYGIGFKSGDTWVIRRDQFKGFLGKGADISIIDMKTDKVLIFEGFIDFLSYLTAKNINDPKYTVIVLNSAVFINRALDFIKKNDYIKTVDYFRDRDDTGEQSIKRLEKHLNDTIINDKSEVYSNYKDLNEWLIHEYQRT